MGGTKHAERHLSRQRTEAFILGNSQNGQNQAQLGIGGVSTSDTREAEGYNSVQVLARADRAFTVRVFMSNDGTNWVLEDIESSVVDAVSAEQVVTMSAAVTGLLARVTITNTSGVATTAYSSRAYLIAHGGVGGGGGGGGGGFAADTRDATSDANFAAALIGMLTNTRVASLDNVTANYRRNLGDAVSAYAAAGRVAASTYGEWMQAVLTGRNIAGTVQFPVAADQVVNFAGSATTLISLLTASVVMGVDTIGVAVNRPVEARVVGSYDGITSAGGIALYTVANMFGRDTTGAAVVRPIEARDATADADFAETLIGILSNARLSARLVAAAAWIRLTGDPVSSVNGRGIGDVVGLSTNSVTVGTDSAAAVIRLIEGFLTTASESAIGVTESRESGYADMLRGRRFSFTHQTPGTSITAQAAFVATTPTLLAYNSAGSTAVVGLRTQRIDITSATTAPVFVTIMLDTADRFSAGGTVVTGQNWNEASATAYPGTAFRFNATATAAGGGTRYLGTFSIPAGAGQSLTFNSKDGIQVTGVGSIGIYVYDSAATVAPTCLFTTEVFAY